MKNVTSLFIFKELNRSWNIDHSADWEHARYFVAREDVDGLDNGIYILIVTLFSASGNEATSGCYDYTSKEQVEQVIHELNENYFEISH